MQGEAYQSRHVSVLAQIFYTVVNLRIDIIHSAERSAHMFSTQPPTPARLAQWKRIRTAGKRQYVLSYGVLRIGTSLFVILGGFLLLMDTSLFSLFMGGTRLPIPLSVPDNLWLLLLVIASVCATLGYIVGKSRWNNNEEWYQYYMNSPIDRRNAE
jgi:hypothetical protein